MKPSHDRLFRAVQNGTVRAASLLVPALNRSDWRREWNAELWHVRHTLCEAGAPSWPAQREVTAFCLGSLRDAWCLHRESRPAHQPEPRISGAAGQCLLRLCTLLAVCVVLASLLPGVEAVRDPARFQVNPGVILIQTSASGDQFAPTIAPALYRDWKSTRQRYFDEFAFYRTVRETTLLDSRRARWNVTHASPNLFSLLGLQLPFEPAAIADEAQLPTVIISHDAWRREFAYDPSVAGRVIRIGSGRARIAGVMPYGMWRLPESPDAWLLEPDSLLAHGSPRARGYLVAHLSPLGQDWMHGGWVSITVPGAEDDDQQFFGVSFAGRLRGPWAIFQFALILAFLALPAVTSVTLGESNYSSHRPSRKRAVLRWAFLLAKFVLVAAIAYFASLDLAWGNSSNYSALAEFAQLVWAFTICLFGFRWALADQRQRCPVCLRRVTHPAQVGLASRTFLGWNGTEMICMGGHTLLHVPSLPTSWFGGQRWMYLDTSWEFLFAD
jgi:MacB-like periplasmic core domain